MMDVCIIDSEGARVVRLSGSVGAAVLVQWSEGMTSQRPRRSRGRCAYVWVRQEV